jgi:hypothetical protein
MTIIDIEDTVKFHRQPVGEERTRVLPIYANKDVPRRPSGSGKVHVGRTAFAYVGSTGELPIYAPYVGQHRAPDEAAPAAEVPSLLARIVAALCRIGG